MKITIVANEIRMIFLKLPILNIKIKKENIKKLIVADLSPERNINVNIVKKSIIKIILLIELSKIFLLKIINARQSGLILAKKLPKSLSSPNNPVI